MTESPRMDIGKLSPDRLMSRFTRSGLVVWIIAAFALHVVVLGGTSVDYLHGMVDPAWKQRQDVLKAEARRKANAEKAAEAAKANDVAPAAGPTSAPTSGPARKGTPAAKAGPGGDQPGKRALPKELTTMPKPKEIPAVPGTGLSIEETEKR